MEIEETKYELRLYVAGKTTKSVTALTNLKKYCEEHLKGQYKIEVIDLLVQPQLAEGDQIFGNTNIGAQGSRTYQENYWRLIKRRKSFGRVKYTSF